jgi:hypothetical protein
LTWNGNQIAQREVPLTLDEEAREKPAYENARRKALGEFSILRE